MNLYILNGKTPVLAPNSFVWSQHMGTNRFNVRSSATSESRVSTIFLGFDHSFGQGPPLLFETMIFGGAHHGLQLRCSTWDEAVLQHQKAMLFANFPTWRAWLVRWIPWL